MQFLLLTIYTHHPRDLISLSLYFLSTCNAPLFLHIVLIFILTYIFHFTVVCLYYLAPLSFCFAGFSLPSSLSFTICSVFYYLLCFLTVAVFWRCSCSVLFRASALALRCRFTGNGIFFLSGWSLLPFCSTDCSRIRTEICVCANTVKKPLPQAGRRMSFQPKVQEPV